MKDNNNGTAARGGVGFLGLLQIVFIVLKLCNVIAWSWWAVLLPAIISVGLFVVVAIAFIIIVLLPSGNKKGDQK